MRRWSFSVLLVLGMISISGRVYSQVTNTTGIPGQPWPTLPPVGIGTGAAQILVQNALQIHHDPTPGSLTWPAILRFSDGVATTTDTMGQLGLITQLNSQYSSLSAWQDLILRQKAKGDIIITNWWPAGMLTRNSGGAIRMATAGDTTVRTLDTTLWRSDYERMTIAPNGNVGIDVPPIPATGLDSVRDQFQIGGGVTPYPGNPCASPGLTIYGGNRYENMSIRGGGVFPDDWRYISYNHWIDHTNPSASRFHRSEPMSSSTVSFSENWGGNIDLSCFPYDVTRGIDNFTHKVTMEVRGDGLQMWSTEGDSDRIHYLFQVYRPNVISWPGTHNKYGLFYHHTPVYIGTDTNALLTPEFTNITGISPSIGDCWKLVVNGAVLAKEVFVLGNDWPDYVFDPGYKLPTFDELDAYIKANHHLPGIPSAKAIETTGVPLGKTESQLTQKVEELTLYLIQQNKEIEALKQDVEALKKGGTR